jgi:hypothetical protein
MAYKAHEKSFNRSRKAAYERMASESATAKEQRNRAILASLEENARNIEEIEKEQIALAKEERAEKRAAPVNAKKLTKVERKIAEGRALTKTDKSKLAAVDRVAAKKAEAQAKRDARKDARKAKAAALHAALKMPSRGGDFAHARKRVREDRATTRLAGNRGQHMRPCGNAACRRCFPAQNPNGRFARVHRYGHTVWGAVNGR